MKKILPLALIAALPFSAAACSDSDSCPGNLLAVGLMQDLNGIGPKGADGRVKAIDVNSVETAVTDCEAFIVDLGNAVDKNKGITKEQLTTDWDQYKNGDALCKIDLGIVIAAQSVNFAINYPVIQQNIKTCGGGAIAIAGESASKLQENATTLEGWADILGQASKVTAAAADANK